MPSPRVSSRVLLPLLALVLLVILVLPPRSEAAPPPESHYLSPVSSPLTLPKTTVGEESASTDFKLTNTSGGTVSVEYVEIGSSPFKLKGGTCERVLLAGEECSVGVSFAPTAAGPTQDIVEIAFEDGGYEILQLAGQAVEPEIAFVPASEDFGLVALHEHGNGSLLLVNQGEAPIHPSGSSIEGPDSQRFSYDFGSCQGRELKPAETCVVAANFEPQDRVDYEATLHAFADSATATAVLKGRGGGPIIEPVGTIPGFGPVAVGTAGVVRTVTIQNSGDLPAGFFIGILAGGDSGSFQLLSESCTMHLLAPGASCSAQVRFRPLAAGPQSATLAYFGDGEGGALVPLDGTGVNALASLSTGSLGFGPLAAGQRSAPLRIGVRNGGAEPIETGQISLVGADLDQFALAGDECSGAVIAPGAECVLSVRFVPDSAGAKNARLRVDAPGGTLTATLSGIATAAPTPVTTAQAKKQKKHRKAKRKHRRHHRHHAGRRSR
jgi:hypothetical protein